MARKDIRHLRIRSSHLRALLHEAWKDGNHSLRIPSDPEFGLDRHAYVNKVMVDQGFSVEQEKNDGK